jgi:TatD DNase family protein
VPTVYVDSHCHLDQCPDPIRAVQAAAHAGVVVIAVTQSPDRYQLIARSFSARSNVRVGLGLHPLVVGSIGRLAVREFARLLPSVDYVGEVGLDFSAQGRPTKDAQRAVFEEIVSLPGARAALWTVHSRGAEVDVIATLEAARVPAVLHWFTGPATLVERGCSAGLFFSINASMVASKSGQAIIAAVSRERVLTETDAPFAASPGGRREPSDVIRVVEALAKAWGWTTAEAASQIFKNMATAFAQREPRPGA